MKDVLAMILIVEECSYVAGTIQAMLQRRGFSVVVASNGQDARAILSNFSAKIRLMLVAISLPKMTGAEFVDSIPTLDPRIPVLFTSTGAEPELTQIVQQNFPVLCKPFSWSMLIEAVGSLLPKTA